MQIPAAVSESSTAAMSACGLTAMPYGASVCRDGMAAVTRSLAAGELSGAGCCSLDVAAPRLLAMLLRQAPAVVFASPSHAASAAILYRLLRRRSRLLVWCDAAPPQWRLLRRAMLRLADGVLMGSPSRMDFEAVLGRAKSVFVLPGPYDVAAFLEGPVARKEPAAYRIVVTSALEADDNGIHVLRSAARWAEGHPTQRIELCWTGAGDMRGVLAAQPVPGNCTQTFTGPLTQHGIVRCFAQAGLVIAGATRKAGSVKAVEAGTTRAMAMASGLVALFDSSPRSGTDLLFDPACGIGFDDRRPDGLFEAITTAMASDVATLDAMRGDARLRATAMDRQGFDARLQEAMRSVVRGPAPQPPAVGHFKTGSVVEAR